MSHQLHEPWTANVVGRMHRYGIGQGELAKRCGYTEQYISQILNGKREFKSEEARTKVKRKIFDNLRVIELEVMNEFR